MIKNECIQILQRLCFQKHQEMHIIQTGSPEHGFGDWETGDHKVCFRGSLQKAAPPLRIRALELLAGNQFLLNSHLQQANPALWVRSSHYQFDLLAAPRQALLLE